MNEANVKPVKLSYACCEPQDVTQSNLCPIILHHGITSSKERWRPVLQKLANRTKRKVYAIDARNHGESERSEFFNFNILGKDLEHFMKTNNIPRASLIGHSMGGIAAMVLALNSPEKVEKLVIEDISPKEFPPELYYVFGEMIEEQIKCLVHSTPEDTDGAIQQKLRECIYRTIPMISDADRDVIQEKKFQVKKTETGYEPMTNLKVILKAIKNPPIFHFHFGNTFNGETLFAYGSDSSFCVYEDKDIILKFFPKAQFHCFEGAGHEVCNSHPEEFIQKVVQFL